MPAFESKDERRKQILNRLILLQKQCQTKYGGRRELASEEDLEVHELIECIEDALTFGIKTNTISVPISLLQNVQDIVSGTASASNNDFPFWTFCLQHLTEHERQRFNNLKNVWTNRGKAKAFIRSALNEKSLERYILTWLNDDKLSNSYEPFSLFLDPESANLLPSIASGLSSILFAFKIDSPDINVISVRSMQTKKDEPLIFVPTPVETQKKISAVKRPITSASEVNFVIPNVQTLPISAERPFTLPTTNVSRSDYPVFPVLSDLCNDLPSEFSENLSGISIELEKQNCDLSSSSQEIDSKSICSSEYSKESSASTVSQSLERNRDSVFDLQEKLREMSERCALLETRVAQLSLENRQLRRITNYTNRSPSSSNVLITIPHVKLIRSRHKKYYNYEMHVTMVHTFEKWILQRRYREFYRFNETLKITNCAVSKIDFPPKKRFGNMNTIFVEERRQQLQIYIRNVIDVLPEVECCQTKEELQQVCPFFKEISIYDREA